MKGFFGLIMFWLTISNKYERLRNDPTKQHSVSLGVESILMSILGAGATVGLAYLTYLCFTVEGLAGLLTWIFGLIFAFSALAVFIELVVASLFYAIYQIRLNRHPIGYVALVLSILIIAGSIVAAILILKRL